MPTKKSNESSVNAQPKKGLKKKAKEAAKKVANKVKSKLGR